MTTKRRASKRLRPGQVSLERAISKLGIASRTQARAAILGGLVRVDGVVRKEPGFAVVPERVRIELSNEPMEAAVKRTFALYKPRGVVTTRLDPQGRKTVFDLVTTIGMHLVAVGRLDWATSGLLLLTNDTRLADRLTDPTSRVRRVYLVTVRGSLSPERASQVLGGLDVDGSNGRETLRAEALEVRKQSGKETHLVITLTEGKNREIRRIFDELGHPVTKLKRVAYGPVELESLGLRPGEFRELTPEEVGSLTRTLGTPVGK